MPQNSPKKLRLKRVNSRLMRSDIELIQQWAAQDARHWQTVLREVLSEGVRVVSARRGASKVL